MPRIIGIDIGGSTTKIIGVKDGEIFSPILVRANDPISSIYGAFGKFMNVNKLSLTDVDKIMITGVGSTFLKESLFGIPTARVDEFQAIGRGGIYLTGLNKAIIISMGTGTALVAADKKTAAHLGGTGIGGGTLLGLSNKMLNVRNFNDLIEIAQDGNLSNVDLTIEDITLDIPETLDAAATASNFGKISDLATRSDLALGIINLVFQTIGMMAIFASREHKINEIVLTGNLANVPQSHGVFDKLSEMFDVRFHLPHYAEYATAVGAAICFSEDVPFTEIGI